ncbi:hypothetical protein PC123_g1367 [Phytophthora cactorum]|nr:hypothetical protein PC120_g672 [Phytophthora cactorum]KAG4063835.1 hypothetical protein PC123_g1367 [Phytophthora cactorum]
MVDFLESTPLEPDLSVGRKKKTPGEAKKLRWEHVQWAGARSGMQTLLNQALPNSFLSTLADNVSKMEPCDVWRQLEQAYGLGDAAGLIEITKSWSKITTSNWKDLGSLFAHLNTLRNDINRKTKALIGQEMVSES